MGGGRAEGDGKKGQRCSRRWWSRKGLPQAVHLFWGRRLGADKGDKGGLDAVQAHKHRMHSKQRTAARHLVSIQAMTLREA